MQRAYEAYLKDILESIRKIEKYTENMSYGDFKGDELRQDAVARNLEIIGEAVKKIPDEIKNRKTEIEWKKIAGLRDILAHEYFGINLEIVWDVMENKLPDLKTNTQAILYELKRDSN